MEHQGYHSTNAIVYQDNKSTILLANNGPSSSSRRTRHVNIRYFFVTDCIQNGELRTKYCPTKDMIGDFFTKPLQGYLFYKLRALVMNMDEPVENSASTGVLQVKAQE